jgi:anti-sigma factor RsiW
MSATRDLSQEDMLAVMAYADGELEGDELERVKKLLDESDQASELLASLHAIGDGVRSSIDPKDIDIRDVVMARLPPSDLDTARLRRTQRTRIAVVGATIVAIAAAVLFYVRDGAGPNGPHAQNPSGTSPNDTMLASASTTGVQVDFVDTPSAVSVFYVPAESAGGETDQATDTPPSVVVWIPETAP